MANNDAERSPPAAEVVEAAMTELVESQRVLNYNTKEFTIELLVAKFTGKDADIVVPHYQRNFNWDPRRQSRFIESLLIGLPVPFLFFADMEDGRYEVVDGNQRLNTCAAFLSNELELEGLERVALLDGFRYRDLPRNQQRRFYNRTIRSIVLSSDASEEDRRDLFDRINTGSLIAEPIEVRRGAHIGPVTNLIEQLATDEVFQRVCPVTDAAKRKREREELITRFLAFTDGLEGYKDRVGKFLSRWQRTANEHAERDAQVLVDYEASFHQVMKFVANYFPYGFKKSATARTTRRVRFHALSVGTARALQEEPTLLKAGPKIPVEPWLTSDDFFALTTSSGANVTSGIIAREEYVCRMLRGLKAHGEESEDEGGAE